MTGPLLHVELDGPEGAEANDMAWSMAISIVQP